MLCLKMIEFSCLVVRFMFMRWFSIIFWNYFKYYIIFIGLYIYLFLINNFDQLIKLDEWVGMGESMPHPTLLASLHSIYCGVLYKNEISKNKCSWMRGGSPRPIAIHIHGGTLLDRWVLSNPTFIRGLTYTSEFFKS